MAGDATTRLLDKFGRLDRTVLTYAISTVFLGAIFPFGVYALAVYLFAPANRSITVTDLVAAGQLWQVGVGIQIAVTARVLSPSWRDRVHDIPAQVFGAATVVSLVVWVLFWAKTTSDFTLGASHVGSVVPHMGLAAVIAAIWMGYAVEVSSSWRP